MTRAWKHPTRAVAALAALLLLCFGTLSTTSAHAAAGDNGNAAAAQAAGPGAAAQTAPAAAAAAAPTPAAASPDHTAGASATKAPAQTPKSDKSTSSQGSSSSAGRAGGPTTTSGGAAANAVTKVKNNDDRHTPMGEQPVSGADQNTGGANGQCSDTEPDAGYFCGTVRNVASGNGQGNGLATGKPWQAHVGKADNKNPPGQGQNDANNGYECDGNKGIAKGNPAHTSCVTTTITPVCVPTPQNNFCGQPQVCVPTPTQPCVTVLPEAEVPGSNRPPTVAGVEQVAGPQPPAGVEQVAGPSTVVGPSGILPSTGVTWLMDVLAGTGMGLLLLGALVLLFQRRAHRV